MGTSFICKLPAAAILSLGLEPIYGPLLIYCVLSSCAIQFPAFSDSTKGLTCIQDTLEGAGSIIRLKCDNSLVEWLQAWGGSFGQKLISTRPKSCGFPGALSSTGGALSDGFLDLRFKTTFSGMDFTHFTAPLITVSVSQTYTQECFCLLDDGVMMTYTRNVHTQCSTGLDTSPCIIIFLDKMNHWFVVSIMVTATVVLFLLSNLCSPPISQVNVAVL